MKQIILNTLVLLVPFVIQGQIDAHVDHLSGTKKVGDVKVEVTSSGTVASNSDYCADTSPYHVGGDGVGTGDGTYYFEFTPAVSAVSLNFSALSSDGTTYNEIIIIKVNGKHYKIPQAGEKNNCDSQAIINEDGNIEACTGCYGAGFNGLVIEGPIKELAVKDSCLFGNPAGTVFSLFIGKGTQEQKEIKSVRALRLLKVPNNRDQLKIIGIPSKSAELLVYDENGNELKFMAQTVKNNQLIDVRKLKSGYYVFVLKSEGFREERSIVLQ